LRRVPHARKNPHFQTLYKYAKLTRNQLLPVITMR